MICLIAPDIWGIQENNFSYLSMKTYVVGTHLKCLNEALLMSTHNICFRGEIRKYQYFFAEKKKSTLSGTVLSGYWVR